ncbi:MAG: hypothetical protein LLG02_16070 [Pelosinus sp.]|nr:hypothetical protein [Pelosinus sp.]
MKAYTFMRGENAITNVVNGEKDYVVSYLCQLLQDNKKLVATFYDDGLYETHDTQYIKI